LNNNSIQRRKEVGTLNTLIEQALLDREARSAAVLRQVALSDDASDMIPWDN